MIPAAINRRPVSFLSLLDINQQGQVPRLVNATVQPVVDMTRFYAAGDLRRVNTTISMAAIGITGGASPIVVPAGENWLISSFSAQSLAALPAGMTINATIATFDNFWPGTSGTVRAPYLSATVGNAWAVAMLQTDYWVARAGTVFAICVSSIAGGPANVALCIEYLPLSN